MPLSDNLPIRGVPPRLRDCRRSPATRTWRSWGTPAPAGLPRPAWWRRLGSSVQPRACGIAGPDLIPSFRSIPAPAGLPSGSGTSIRSLPVHPHACGIAKFAARTRTSSRGPPPRLRDCLGVSLLAAFCCRSVYPRSCGSCPVLAGLPPSLIPAGMKGPFPG